MDASQEFLRRQDIRSKIIWSISGVEAGFEKFYDDFGHYPSSPEIDRFEYLPSTKQIQRRFGGLMKLRKSMNLRHAAPDHNRGAIRRKIASEAMNRAHSYEEDYYTYLVSLIPELYVHEQKVIRYKGSRAECDYFLYLPNSADGIVIDVFYAMDILNLLKQVRIKEPKYTNMPYAIYFISMNTAISQDLIDARLVNRKSGLDHKIHVCNVDYFNKNVLPGIASQYVGMGGYN